MKKKIYTLALGAILLVGCSQEEHLAIGEEVKMTFTANLSNGVQSRAEDETLLANKMVVGIYEKTYKDGNEEYNLAQKGEPGDITSNNPEFKITLIKGTTYKVVFWAYNQEDQQNAPYDFTDLKAIKFNKDASNYEAFTAVSEDIIGGQNDQKEITLKRPVAQVRIGTSKEDWDAAEALKRKPTSTTVSLSECPDSYNALTGQASENTTTLNFNKFEFTDPIKVFTVNNVDYYNFGTYYTFASITQTEENGESKETGSKITCTLKVNNKIEDNEEEFFTETYSDVEVKPNYRTNIIGRLMTGTTTYNVTLSNGFEQPDSNKEIE